VTRAAAIPAAESARRALRTVASAVTVLTVNWSGMRHGTTVSAVLTVSRDPLIMGVCLRPGSTFGTTVRRVGRFSVNVLATTQAAVARRFAAPDRPPGDPQFTGLSWTTDGLTGAPLIRGCVGHLSCRALDWQRVGDHDLLLAEVIGGTALAGAPLLTYSGRLHVTNAPIPAQIPSTSGAN
jgi:flavin reductase